MCWCCQTIIQRYCYICDILLTGTVCLGTISTATTTALQYTEHIDNWEAVAIPSVITFMAILGCVLRCAYQVHSQSLLNNQQSTIVINQHLPTTKPSISPPLPSAVAIPVETVEMTTQNSDIVQKIHKEWRNSRDESI